MFFELRFYPVKPGRMDEWVDRMETVVIPFQVFKGMTFVASFVSLDNPDEYIWIRRFESEEQKEALYKAVYDSPEWKETIGLKNGEMIDREKIRVIRMAATPKSVIR
ncbi:MAG: NIPSNAP family protein [Proteobacteria bacterium]|nr:NIPSNAP family protein [Pseudomonadota bacterium]